MSNMLKDHLKDAVCKDSDGKNVRDTQMLRGGPEHSTAADKASNITKQHTSTLIRPSGKDGGENDLHG